MEIEIQEKLDTYLRLLEAIEERTHDRQTATAVLAEVAKDIRMGQMRQEKRSNGDGPATQGQIGYLKKLGAAIPEGLTVRQASELIDRMKAQKQEPVSVVKVPQRVP
jgi:hypothetical protein